MKRYIDKDALLAEIDKRLHQLTDAAFDSMIGRNLIEIKDFINTLEAKEVGFERELSKYLSEGIHRFFPNETNNYYTMDSVIWQDYVIETAKHFFELGLKAQKGE